MPVIIGFLASLLGISGLARKVTKLIGKIRKRVDKAVDKLIKKAKSAFRRLLGRGNRRAQQANQNGPDNRTEAEKRRDVKAATRDAENYYNANGKDPDKLKTRFPHIKQQYQLKNIKLIQSANNISVEVSSVICLVARFNARLRSLLYSRRNVILFLVRMFIPKKGANRSDMVTWSI